MVLVGINLVLRASFLTQSDSSAAPINRSALGSIENVVEWASIVAEF